MNKIIYVILIFSVSVFSSAASLDGTWQEDKKKSLQWNLLNTKTDPEKLKQLNGIMGHMYVTYKDGVMCQFFEPYSLKNGEKTKEVPRLSTILSNYEVLAKNEFGFVLKIKYENKTESIDMLVYEGEESQYGVRLSTEDFGFPGNRVYFKKVAAVKWNYDCPK